MPYADPEKQKAYKRDWARLSRSVEPGGTAASVSVSFRLATSQDVLDLLAEQIGIVRDDADAGKLEKARCVGYLAGIALKAIECGNMAARLEAMETILKERKTGNENHRN